MVSQYGAGIKTVKQSFAERCVSAGKARYASNQPKTNPDIQLTNEEKEELRNKYVKNSFMREEAYEDDVCWITGSQLPQEIQKAAHEQGFNIKLLSPGSFSMGEILRSPFIILSSNLDQFAQIQLAHLKVLLFQKSIPYIFRVESVASLNEKKWFQHCMNRSRGNFYVNMNVYDGNIDVCGPQTKRLSYVEKKPALFWRRVNKVLKESK